MRTLATATALATSLVISLVLAFGMPAAFAQDNPAGVASPNSSGVYNAPTGGENGMPPDGQQGTTGWGGPHRGAGTPGHPNNAPDPTPSATKDAPVATGSDLKGPAEAFPANKAPE